MGWLLYPYPSCVIIVLGPRTSACPEVACRMLTSRSAPEPLSFQTSTYPMAFATAPHTHRMASVLGALLWLVVARWPSATYPEGRDGMFFVYTTHQRSCGYVTIINCRLPVEVSKCSPFHEHDSLPCNPDRSLNKGPQGCGGLFPKALWCPWKHQQ